MEIVDNLLNKNTVSQEEEAAFYSFLLPPTISAEYIEIIKNAYGPLKMVFSRSNIELEKLPLPPKIIERLKHKRDIGALSSAEKELTEFRGIVLSFFDLGYPSVLHSMHNKPILFFAQGNCDLLNNKKYIGIVGSRKPSLPSISRLTRYLEKEIQQDYTVVSGTAKGIDTLVHQTAIKFELKIIAMTPSGLNRIFPKESRRLCDDIIQSGNLVISEFPLNLGSYKSNFPIRNKTLSSMCDYIIAVDAKRNSGTMNTVEETKKLNKQVILIQEGELIL